MFLKELTDLNGVSGGEEVVREYIKEYAVKHCDDIKIDSIGNLITFKKGRNSRFKVMLSAHMDEVGFIAVGYNEGGTIKFKTVGGIDERILLGKRVVVGENKINGIIGSKPIHLQDKEERNKNIKIKNMYIDIGAENREEAGKLVSLGELIAFDSKFVEMGDECIKAKALDDRVGCSILMEMLNGIYDFDLYACFTVQEEVGLRGSEVAAFTVKPDLALIIEGTTCSDVPGVEKYEYSTVLGDGAAITIMDRTSYADKKLVNFIYDTAKKNNVKVQYKQTNTGGNDAGKIQLTGNGVKVASISVPCRYIHSPVSMMNKNDFESCKEIVRNVLNEFNNQDIICELLK